MEREEKALSEKKEERRVESKDRERHDELVSDEGKEGRDRKERESFVRKERGKVSGKQGQRDTQ